jgi:hypothetical protein
MAKAPTKPGAKRAPARRAPSRSPLGDSRAAGQPTQASAAATAPRSFYDTGDTQRADHYEPGAVYEGDPVPRAEHVSQFAEQVRQHATHLETGGSADRDVVEAMAEEAMTDPDDLAAEIARIRGFRKPLGAYSQKLALPERPQYKRHWFNDVAGRVAEAELNGWTHVRGTNGKPISRCVGSGRDKGALYAFAMEIPMVFWQEEQDARNRAAAEKMESLKSTPFRAPRGVAQAADRGKFYDPSEHDAGPIQIVKS